MHSRLLALAAVFLLASAGTGDEPARRYQIELLYTIHANVDTYEKFQRIRALVLKAYPDAEFANVSVADQKTYYAGYRDRLLEMASLKLAETLKEKGAVVDPALLREKLGAYGYRFAQEQVFREVQLRSIYQFLHAQAKHDTSLKTIFDKLKEKDDPKNPVCGTEPGKTLVVYRDFGDKGLSGQELSEIEDSGVRFGPSFLPRVTALGNGKLPKMSRKADTLGTEGHGRQIFRLVAVTEDPAPEAPSDHK